MVTPQTQNGHTKGGVVDGRRVSLHLPNAQRTHPPPMSTRCTRQAQSGDHTSTFTTVQQGLWATPDDFFKSSKRSHM